MDNAPKRLEDKLDAIRHPGPVEWSESGGAAEHAPMTTDEAREYLVKFMEQHFTDKTFHRYIRGQIGGGGPLAGDFAWQMARALRMLGAPASTDNPSTAGAAPVRYEYRVNGYGNPTPWRETSKERCEEMKKSPQVEFEGEGVVYEVRALFAAPVAQSTAGAATIDTPEFRELLTAQQATEEACSSNGSDANRDAANDAWDALIAHIDSRLAAPAAQAPASLDLAKLRALVDAARVCTSVTSMREIVECIGALGEKGGGNLGDNDIDGDAAVPAYYGL